MKTIYFVRHGQTLLNRFNRMQGWIDSPLTKKGEEQALATGKKLAEVHFDIAISSDMNRAIKTLDIILGQNKFGKETKIEVQTGFREVYFGSWEGVDSTLTWNMIGGANGSRDQNELIKKYGLLKVRDFMRDADPFHEAEGGQQLADRIDNAVNKVKSKLEDGQTALIVSHGTMVKNLAGIYSPANTYIEQPNNGSVTILDVTNQPVIKEYNK